eukprot:m.1575 g.1575  ORF g.1575 m.1575 type:complete len:425 (+) comp7277_c0_seq1:80-1354(+)
MSKSPQGRSGGLLPYACLYIDASWWQFLSAFSSITRCDDSVELTEKIESLFGGSSCCIVSFCVRSAFDVYLQVSGHPPGSQIIMTAVNIPDMSRIIRHHGFTPVPVDIQSETLAPDVTALEAIVTSQTVAIVVAHLYGRWIDMTGVVAFAKKHKLDVIEDCAQSFSGFDNLGHPDALLTLFSFGAIKHATGFGGGVTVVRNPDLLAKIRERQSTYPVLSRWMFFKRLLRYFLVAVTLNSPSVNFYVRHLLGFFNVDHKKYAVTLLRGFRFQLMPFLRWRPSGAMLHSLHDALMAFSPDDYARNTLHCEYVIDRLPATVKVPGSKTVVRNHWLFPVIVSDPEAYIRELTKRGVDAYRGVTQLDLVQPENKEEFPFPKHAEELMNYVIYLPVHKRVPFGEIQRLCEILAEVAEAVDFRKVLVKSNL